jgi:hypothetical protein
MFGFLSSPRTGKHMKPSKTISGNFMAKRVYQRSGDTFDSQLTSETLGAGEYPAIARIEKMP